jgi:hypothetical protein
VKPVIGNSHESVYDFLFDINSSTMAAKIGRRQRDNKALRQRGKGDKDSGCQIPDPRFPVSGISIAGSYFLGLISELPGS